MTLTKGAFVREYDEKWTGEVYLVQSRFVRDVNIPMYKLSDYSGEKMRGTYYENELQQVKIAPESLFTIDRVLAKRVRGSETEFKVSYKYWSPKFKTWVLKKDLIKLK